MNSRCLKDYLASDGLTGTLQEYAVIDGISYGTMNINLLDTIEGTRISLHSVDTITSLLCILIKNLVCQRILLHPRFHANSRRRRRGQHPRSFLSGAEKSKYNY